MMERIPQDRVRLLPGLFKERRDLNVKYLLSLDTRALLQNYMLEAGEIPEELCCIKDPGESFLHWGWEAPVSPLRGSFLGHWMSAAAFLVRTDKSRVLKAKLFDLVDSLREFQLKNGGKWLAPIPEKYFEFLAAGKNAGAPQYVMHKLFMGLLDVYECTSYAPALTILSHLSDWYIDWFARCDAVDPKVAGRGGAAGMLEIWVRLYRLTGEDKYRSLLKRYEYPAFFSELRAGTDPLSGLPAKDLVPWVLGAATIYEIKRKDEWLKLVQAFWDCAVTKRGAFASGGADSGERFVPPYSFSEYAGDSDQEFCTAYHMVRLADCLFRFTGDTLYADHIERMLYNAFLAQQHPKSGMPARFLPQKSGARKRWGTPLGDFSCCHGTMLQAHAFVNSLIWYKDDDRVTVGQYIESRAEFKINGTPVVLELHNNSGQDAPDAQHRFSYSVKVRCGRPQRFLIRLRIPGWVKGMPIVSVDSEKRFITEDVIQDGYLKLDREWSDSRITISFPTELAVEALPDDSRHKAILEGPVVLAALSPGIQMDEDVRKLLKKHSGVNTDGSGVLQGHYRCRLRGVCTDFIPLYEVEDQVYTIYNAIL